MIIILTLPVVWFDKFEVSFPMGEEKCSARRPTPFVFVSITMAHGELSYMTPSWWPEIVLCHLVLVRAKTWDRGISYFLPVSPLRWSGWWWWWWWFHAIWVSFPVQCSPQFVVPTEYELSLSEGARNDPALLAAKLRIDWPLLLRLFEIAVISGDYIPREVEKRRIYAILLDKSSCILSFIYLLCKM
jgi:hypothetical protein